MSGETTWNGQGNGVDAANHHTRHEDGGADEISLAGLSGVAADPQHVIESEVVALVNAGIAAITALQILTLFAGRVVVDNGNVVCDSGEIVYY